MSTESTYWVRIIRAFRDRNGITNIYNYKGHPVHTGPIGELEKTWIDDHTVRWTDVEKKKKK